MNLRRIVKMKVGYVAVLVWLASAALLWWLLPPKPRATLSPADWRPGSFGLSWENYRLVGFSGDGKTLATLDVGSRGYGPVRLWDVATATQRATFPPNGSIIDFAEFSPNGRSLLCRCVGGSEVAKWVLIDPRSGMPQASTDSRPARFLTFSRELALHAFSADGTTLAVVHHAEDPPGYKFTVWDLEKGQLKVVIDHGPTPQGIPPLREGIPPHPIALSRDGQLLAAGCVSEKRAETGGQRGADSVTLWNTATGKEHSTLNNFVSPISAFAFSPDGTKLATIAIGSSGGNSSFELRLELWEVKSGRRFASVNTRLARGWPAWMHRGLGRLSYSADGNRILFQDDPPRERGELSFRFAILYDAAQTPPRSLCPERAFDRAVFSPNLAIGATASSPPLREFFGQGPSDKWGEEVFLWDVASKSLVASLKQGGAIHPCTFSSDGRFLTTWDSWGVNVWDVGTRRKVMRSYFTLVPRRFLIPLNTLGGPKVAYSPRGDFMAVDYWDGTVEIWDLPPARRYGWIGGLSLVPVLLLFSGWALALWLRSRSAPRASSSHLQTER